MGMFNTVLVDCPYCEGTIELQSKAGSSTLARDSIFEAELADVADLEGDHSCVYCGKRFVIVVQRIVHVSKGRI